MDNEVESKVINVEYVDAPMFIFNRLNDSPVCTNVYIRSCVDMHAVCYSDATQHQLLLSLVKSQRRVFILQFSQPKLTISQQGDRKSTRGHSPALPLT